jgi:hypothetical protein
MADPTDPGTWDNCLFDLRGFVVPHGCDSPAQLDGLNARVDALEAAPEEWIGDVHRPPAECGVDRRSYFNAVEGGRPFEEMIDNPA